jgi:hypothetical protein
MTTILQESYLLISDADRQSALDWESFFLGRPEFLLDDRVPSPSTSSGSG